MKFCVYSEVLLSCLLSNYLDWGRLLTFSLGSEKEGFVQSLLLLVGKKVPGLEYRNPNTVL